MTRWNLGCLLSLLAVSFALSDGRRAAAAELILPAQQVPQPIAVDLPDGLGLTPGQPVELTEVGAAGQALPAQIVPAVSADGKPAGSGRLTAVIPPRADAGAERRFRLQRVAAEATPFQWQDMDETTLQLGDDGQPVLAYNYGTIIGQGVPQSDHRHRAACYIHPVWGLHGEVLTDDFPRDHYHHHGIFWTWPHIGIEGQSYDSWAGDKIDLRKVDWLHRSAGPAAGVLAVENGWFINPDFARQVMVERVWIRAYAACEGSRAIDLEFTWIPTDTPVTLQGAGGKSYGGLTMRFVGMPNRDQLITVPSGPAKEDLAMTPLKWADYTRHFEGAPGRSGATVMVHPEHPDYPPTWLTRNYGPLCVGWPGVEPQTLEPGRPVRLAYRIWIHAGEVDTAAIQQAYEAYTAAAKARWE